MAYSDNVHIIEQEDKKIVLIGTAHISQHSVKEVVDVIESEQPKTVCVELCQTRYESLNSENYWKNMDIFKVIRSKKTFLLLANLIMSSFQKRMGDQLGVKPGAEMIEAIKAAENINAEVVLADRDVRVTLQRTWRHLTFFDKLKILTQLSMGFILSEDISEEEIEKMKQKDVLSDAMDALSAQAPNMKKILIDERDQYLAQKIRDAPGNHIVAVVGAGHIPGIIEEIKVEHNINKLERIPPSGNMGKWIAWGIPLLIIGLIAYGFFNVDTDVSMEMIQRWIWINGTLSALGTALAFGHPVTVITAFVAAPITSLNPAIAAGWVAGLVEAFLHRPQVKDFENLSEDIHHFSGFWKNKITRILLVVVFANLGSALGTFIGGFAIASLL